MIRVVQVCHAVHVFQFKPINVWYLDRGAVSMSSTIGISGVPREYAEAFRAIKDNEQGIESQSDLLIELIDNYIDEENISGFAEAVRAQAARERRSADRLRREISDLEDEIDEREIRAEELEAYADEIEDETTYDDRVRELAERMTDVSAQERPVVTLAEDYGRDPVEVAEDIRDEMEDDESVESYADILYDEGDSECR